MDGFYPTNDGHVGNLENKSLLELKDILARHEKLLTMRSFLKTLPDQGSKVKKLAETVRLAIQAKTQEDRTSLAAVKEDATLQKDIVNVVPKFKSESREDPSAQCMDSEMPRAGVNIDSVRTQEEISMDQTETDSGLEKTFQRLSVSEQKGESKHYYEVAEQRANQNSGTQKTPMKLNSNLNIAKVEDLPDKFKPPPELKAKHASHKDSSKGHTAMPIDNESADDPLYKHEQVKVISLDESLSLQETQKRRQEALQAELAAQKLVTRLNIKLEPYNPEGRDMRTQEEADSDEGSDGDIDCND